MKLGILSLPSTSHNVHLEILIIEAYILEIIPQVRPIIPGGRHMGHGSRVPDE